MVEIVPTDNLRIGMFVAELDRPWLDSPFLIQGFLIEDDDQIQTLGKLCRFVNVDRVRSVGTEYRADPRQPFVPEQKRLLAREAETPRELLYQGSRRFSIPPPIISVQRELAGHKFTSVRYLDEISVEDELPASRVSFHNTQALLRDLGEQVAAGKVPDLEHADQTVAGLVEGVVRNPDALLWLSKLKRTDNETYDHALSVSIHLMTFGRSLGLPPEELHALGMGGLLKDIGVIRLPKELMLKPGGFTADERVRMQAHVQNGIELLAEKLLLSTAVGEIVSRHHERIDGSGYPQRLVGPAVGLYGEMAGIVDSYCAMQYPRSFRPARTGQWIIDELNGMRDQRFTASVVDEFIQCVGLYPVGTLVELNSGEVGVVFEQNRVRRLKPRVLVLLGPDKSKNRSAGILNLLNDPLVSDGVPYRIVRMLPPGSYDLDPREFYL